MHIAPAEGVPHCETQDQQRERRGLKLPSQLKTNLAFPKYQSMARPGDGQVLWPNQSENDEADA
jgi:hypothetical protein